jgi:NTP pyrophosphatase (non-canonical NTP hydrolase)
MNILFNLYHSTTSLLDRFNVRDGLIEPRFKIFMEEVYEFIEASVTAKITGEALDIAKANEEFVDVVVTGLGVLDWLGIDYDAIENAMQTVIDKNDSKTEFTHQVVNGIIKRKD